MRDASRFFAEDHEKLAELLKGWPVFENRTGEDSGIGFAVRLWNAAKRDGAVAWLEKLESGRGFTLYKEPCSYALNIEMLAVRKDTAGIGNVHARRLQEALRPCGDVFSFRLERAANPTDT